MAEERERIYFRLDPSDWHGKPNEGLWAERLDRSPSGTVYKILNSPFFTRGVSYLDIVRAAPGADGVRLEFAGVLDHAGHSTYMVLVSPTCSALATYWKRLEAMGCTYESTTIDTSAGKKILYSIDVPDTADVYVVYAILEEGERNDVWTFQEGHVGHKLRG